VGQIGLLVALAGVIVWGAYSRRHTVATGIADILHYYEAALDFLAATTWTARLQAALQWAPLHPMALALVIRWCGAEWTYFLGPFYAWGVLVGLSAWSWRISGDYRGGLLTLLASSAALLFGFSENVNFILYPFRETFSFLFLVSGICATIWAYPGTGRGHYVLLLWAGCSYVLAAAVREPAILALSGAVVFVVFQPGRSLRSRGGDVLVLLSPLLVALLALGMVFAGTGILASRQFSGWQSMTAGQTLDAWWGLLSTYFRWLIHWLGFWGSLCSAVGLLWLARRNRPAALMLVVSVLSVVALYATFAFYPRYALSIGLFFLPLAGLGLWRIVLAAGWLAGRVHRRLEELVVPVVALLLLGYCGVKIHRLPPGAVSPAQLKIFRTELHRRLESGEKVLTDARSRLLNEVLLVYFGIEPRTSLSAPRLGEPPQSCLFLKPANEDAVIRAKLVAAPVTLELGIMRYADVEELVHENGAPALIGLGTGEYRWCRVQPWSRKQVEEAFAPADIIRGLLWLDFQESDEMAGRIVKIVDEGGAAVAEYPVGAGNGLIPFAVDGGRVQQGGRVRVESSSLLPARLVVRPDSPQAASYFVLEVGRRPSILKWLERPTGIAPGEKWAATFFDAARFRLPAPRGLTTKTPSLAILLEPRHPRKQLVEFRYQQSGADDLVLTNSIERQRFWQEIPLLFSSGEEAAVVDLTLNVPPDWPNHFRVVGLSVRLVEKPPAP
jgi:hypothetical protein